ncbi:unnamed protein product [Rhizoctonia solani]|uniref:Uncharacterized protein n=1 Tax=Rhizoctonia solani TaxID=456999 RepID=A0A8H2ZYS5_9AGAM|nr:unnamed protein product [Rhizoctonia solani]
MSGELPLSARYDQALSCSSRLSEHSALSPEYKSLSDEALGDLRQVAQVISDLQLFSRNETLEDISTKQLVYFTVPYATAELLLALPSAEPTIRKDILGQAESQLQKFIAYLTDYGVVDDATIQATNRLAQMSKNPAQRREAKIQQYQAEKQLKSRIQALRSQTLATNVEEPANNYDSIRMLVSGGASHAGSVNADDDDLDMDDETRRELTIVLLRLLYAQAQSSLQQIVDEVQILRNMPPPSSSHSQPEPNKPSDDTWRLDITPRGGPDGRGPIMDSQGRPLRPFTILPSNFAERTRLQNEVFRPDHRLPTMTIDEYLAEEERRGNILRGGGKASEQAPTSSEQLAVDSEQDGTRFGDEKSEEKRKKDEEWAAFTDANPKAPQIFPFLLPKPHQPHATPIPRHGQVKFNERRDLKEEADILSDEELEIEELMTEIKTYGHNFLIPIGKNMTLDEESADATDPSEPGTSDSNSQTQSASQAEELGTDLDADMQDLDAEVQDLDASVQDLDASVQDLDASAQDLDADIANEDSEPSIATDQSFVDDERVDQGL